jgi:uncharacterized protein DUF4340
MIRKSTFVVLALAALLGGGVYYYQKRHSTPPPPTDAPKPVFTIQAADIQSITLHHLPETDPKTAIQMNRSGDGWQLAQPLNTRADSSAVEGIADGLAGASSTESEPGTPDRQKAYGLDPGSILIEFTMKDGAKHKLLLGNKDFTGSDVYALADSNQSVSLVQDSLLTSADKTADALRDHAVLHIDADQASAVDLKNSSGEIALKKAPSGWSMTRPDAASADSDSVSTLISAVATGKLVSVTSETAGDLAKYGLSSPAVTFTVTNDIGQTSTLIVGKKQGDDYYARDTSRPTIFEIDGELYKKLTQTSADLIDKVPMHVDESTINEIEIHDSNGTIIANRKGATEEWLMLAPDAQKGKSASSWKVFSVLGGLRADEVIEKPSADIVSGLAQPAYELTLTDSASKKRSLRVTKAIGDFVYAQSSDGAAVYKLKKSSLSDLNITPDDLGS